MIRDRLDTVIREISDFPIKGINFKDITPLLLDQDLSNEIIASFIDKLRGLRIDAIVGVESRGFLFGFLLANALKIPFIPIRKSGKLPSDVLKCKYDLEYGSAEIEIHKDDIKEGWNILIHDDLLATGGTAEAAGNLVRDLGANVLAYAFVVSIEHLKGTKRLKKYTSKIISLINY